MKEKGVQQLGSSGGTLLITPKITSEASLSGPLSLLIMKGPELSGACPGQFGRAGLMHLVTQQLHYGSC